MVYNISGSTFVKNNQRGALCLWESLSCLLPLLSDIHIVDLGSTDNTWEILQDLALHNKKINVYQGQLSCMDAKALADAANESIKKWNLPTGFFWQADEVWHEDLLKLTMLELDKGKQNIWFWRYQLKTNFQTMKWFPHPVHRFGRKDNFVFIGDGMNTTAAYEHDVVGDYDIEQFPKWGGMDPLTIPINQMILDVSQTGGFRDNVPARRQFHAPLYHDFDIEGKTLNQWHREAQANPDWEKPTTPYNIPKIMRYHVGKVHYEVRQDLLEAIRTNTTERYI